MTPGTRSFSLLLLFAACGGAPKPAASSQNNDASRDAGAAANDSGPSPSPNLSPSPPQHLPDNASVRADLHCTQKTDGEEHACTAKGCRLGPPLLCMGPPPPPDMVKELDRRYDASLDTCVCICAADIQRCSEVP